MSESPEERTPDAGDHDTEDERGGGGEGGLSGAVPGAEEEEGGQASPNEPEGKEPPEGP